MGVILTAFSFLSCYFSSKKYHIREGGVKKILFFDKKKKKLHFKISSRPRCRSKNFYKDLK